MTRRSARSYQMLGLFAALAVAHTWPLATAPSTLSRNDSADTMLNEWTLAWVAHQAPRDPWHLFDANIFYPERGTLAYSEPLLVPAALGAPLLWAGASPVLAYNLLLIAGFTLTGWAGSMVVWRWTGDAAAGVLTGVLLAFNAHTMGRLPHLQALHAEFLPLALIACDATLRAPTAKQAARLAAWVTLQALTSIYLLVFTSVALIAGVLARPEDWWGSRARPRVLQFTFAAGLAGAALLPMLLAYRRVGVVRSLDEAAYFAATWHDYLVTPARLHYRLWSSRWPVGSASLFPGVMGLALAIFAVVHGVGWRDRRARMALAFGAAGVVLAFGPAVPGYAALYRWVPLLGAIRNVARFGYLALVAVAILAGFGLAQIRIRWKGARWIQAATVGTIILANVESFSAPIEYVNATPASSVYERLRRTSNAIVAEFPFFSPDHVFHNADYMLNSTHHWRPMLNGYSGIIPPSYDWHYQALRGFPDGAAIAELRAIGVTHVVVHERDLAAWTTQETVDALHHQTDLWLIESDGDVHLYLLKADIDRF